MSRGDGDRGVVVVGAGMASTRLVERLVAAAHPGPVTVLGEEVHAPYNRILLSAVLEGTHRPEALTLRSPAWYADHGVTLRPGVRVTGLDRAQRAVVLEGGERVDYRTLVLATGSLPTLPPIRGAVRDDGTLHPAVHAFRSLADLHRLQEAVVGGPTAPRRAVVVGGGLLGLQVARALTVRGLVVEVVEGGDHLLCSQVGGRAGRLIAADLARLGTTSYTGARAVRLTDDDGSVGLHLDNGYVLWTDLVVLAAGARPSTSLARASGLDVRRGVVVDDTLTTSDPDIRAVGDCAEHERRPTGLVPPAWEQAAVLGDVLGGGSTRYAGTRTVARLRATDLDVAVLGDPVRAAEQPGAQVVEMTNPVNRSHRRLVLRDGALVAAELVGDLSRIGLITQHFDRGTVLGPDEPGALLAPDRPATGAADTAAAMPDDAEVCTCAGVSAGAVRACANAEQARETTRAGTGCGGCAPVVRQLFVTRKRTTTQGARS